MAASNSVSTFTTDIDLVANAMIDAAQPIHATPPHGAHINQDLITFAPTGLVTPARIHQKPLRSSSTSMPSHLSPLSASAPHNPNISFTGRPPLPQCSFPHDPPRHLPPDSCSSFTARFKANTSTAPADRRDKLESELKPRPRKLKPKSCAGNSSI